MGPVFYVMAILGCGEADAACEPVARVDARYESLDACNAATPDAVMRHSDLLYPVVVAQCDRADRAQATRISASDIDLPPPDRRPNVRQAVHQPAKRTSL